MRAYLLWIASVYPSMTDEETGPYRLFQWALLFLTSSGFGRKPGSQETVRTGYYFPVSHPA